VAARTPRKLWVDMTNSPHVLVLRPIMEEFGRRGWDVTVTARDFAQTLPLLDAYGIEYTLIGKHRGRALYAKAWGMASRTSRMIAFGAGRGFELALSHASNDLPVAARVLGIPHVTMFDYEHAKLSHSINVRFSTKALIPDAIPEEALYRYGGRGKTDRYPGLKEEYYLADFEPDPSVLDRLGIDQSKVLVTIRTPPSMAAYHRMENPVFPELLRRIAGRPDVQAVVLLRTPDQKALVDEVEADNLIVPETVVDAPSLVHYSDVVITGGGTMVREAVALGTPAWTVFQGTLGAVDRRLLEEGRLHRLETADDVAFEKKEPEAGRVKRDVSDLADRIEAVAERG
jgi:predicted glycosyltransferase